MLTAATLLAFAVAGVISQENTTQAIQIWAPSEEIAKASVPAYDIVSIKPDKSGIHRRVTRDDGYSFIGWKLQEFIRLSYDLADNQIFGAPSWVKSDPYEIMIKADKDVADYLLKLNPEDNNYMKKRMFQKVLADRLQLKYHRETKELPVYVLTLAKGGSKLREAKPGEALPEGFEKNPRGVIAGGNGQLVGVLCPFRKIVLSLTSILGRPVIDKTGLTGIYDLTLKWNPNEDAAAMGGQGGNLPPAPESSEPSLFTAIQEQLGLKLTSQKGPVEVMVIDHIERPSEN